MRGEAHGQGPVGGIGVVYTQKHTDQENSVLTTVATEHGQVHKYLFFSGGLTGAVKSGIIMYN